MADAATVSSGTCGNNITWELSDEGTLMLSGTGNMPNYDFYSHTPWYSYREQVKKVYIDSGITSVGKYAFSNCSGLTSVIISNSVLSIGYSAFSSCSSLTSSIIGNSVTSIGDYAFASCSGLTSVEIPNSVTSIGNMTFYGCSKIKSVIIGSSVKSIGSSAFSNCSSLTSLNLGNSVMSIGSSAFSKCTSLSSVAIGRSITNIGKDMFAGCLGLKTIKVDENNPNYSASDNVLFNKDKTKLVYCVAGKQGDYIIPNSVTSIGDYAFENCKGLTSVTIPNSVTSIGICAFYDCSGLTYVTIGNSVSRIGSCAFEWCSGLTSVTIPNSVTSLGSSAFNGCSGLTSVTIPNSITKIEEWTFENCSGLTSVTIGNSVTNIAAYAFNYCFNLGEVYCLAKEAPVIDASVFSNTKYSTGTLYVPSESVGAYKGATSWKDWKTIKGLTIKELLDGEDYTNNETMTCDILTFTKTFSDKQVNKWNAFYVPMRINVEEYAGELDFAEIYAFCATVDTNGDGTVDADDENFLFVRPVKTGSIEPNLPYLVRPKEEKTYTINSADNILHKATQGTVEFSTTSERFVVTGLNEPFTVTANDNNYYVSGTGALSMRTSGSTIVKANRWIMHREYKGYGNSHKTDAGAKEYRIIAIGEDMTEATAIETIKAANAVKSGSVYSLDGRKVNPANGLSNGIYIKNGKKYIVK